MGRQPQFPPDYRPVIESISKMELMGEYLERAEVLRNARNNNVPVKAILAVFSDAYARVVTNARGESPNETVDKHKKNASSPSYRTVSLTTSIEEADDYTWMTNDDTVPYCDPFSLPRVQHLSNDEEGELVADLGEDYNTSRHEIVSYGLIDNSFSFHSEVSQGDPTKVMGRRSSTNKNEKNFPVGGDDNFQRNTGLSKSISDIHYSFSCPGESMITMPTLDLGGCGSSHSLWSTNEDCVDMYKAVISSDENVHEVTPPKEFEGFINATQDCVTIGTEHVVLSAFKR